MFSAKRDLMTLLKAVLTKNTIGDGGSTALQLLTLLTWFTLLTLLTLLTRFTLLALLT